MKLKNVKIGVRVQLKEDHPYQSSLKKGMVGAIIEDGDIPYISWDNFEGGSNGYEETEEVLRRLGLPEHSVYSVNIEHLKRIKNCKDV